MKRLSRHKLLTSVAALAGSRLLLPARVRAAAAVTRRLNVREYPGGSGTELQTGQPLFVPPRAYEVPTGVGLMQALDSSVDSPYPENH
jgi:hypothetical protein